MAARSSSASLKPERILRITYKELNELAEKLEKHKEMKTKKKGINSKPKSDIFAKSWTNNNKILFDLKKQSHYISYETH